MDAPDVPKVLPRGNVKREEFDRQLEEFTAISVAAGRMVPGAINIAVLDEDAPKHTDRDYTWDYLLHCAWAARQIAEYKPKRHADFGSYVYFAALCSAFIPTFEFFDIRPIGVNVPGLGGGAADLMNLPFPDNSIESISCLHVLEHIGLGRYGDTLDPEGDQKAANELMRVLQPGGHLLVVFPMNETPRINFNAHRIMSYGMVRRMFEPMSPFGWHFLYARAEHSEKLAAGDYTGCFDFVK